MNKTKEEEFFVKPENRMSEEEMSAAGFGNSENTVRPVVEMIEGKTVPAYIFGGPLVFKSALGDSYLDIMLTLLHHIKEKKLELRGRMRYKNTGRKTVFSNPKMFDAKDYEDARQEARNMYLKLIKESAFKPSEVPWELEIPFGSSAKKAIRLMDESNHFNIGMVPQK
jgi:hypothetical protein